jgi:hypothetical protein
MLSYLLQTTTTELTDRLDDVVERGEEILDTVRTEAEANPVFLGILIGIGALTALVFLWGIAKHAFKAALFGGLLSAAAWIWYFNIR